MKVSMREADSRTRDQLEDEELRETQGSELYFIIIQVPSKLSRVPRKLLQSFPMQST